MIGYFLSASGRIGRRAFVAPILAFFTVALACALGAGASLSGSSVGYVLDNPWTVIGRARDVALAGTPLIIAAPATIALFVTVGWALFALTIKRLHDLGRSGWWSTLLLVPVAAPVLMLVCSLAPGRRPAGA